MLHCKRSKVDSFYHIKKLLNLIFYNPLISTQAGSDPSLTDSEQRTPLSIALKMSTNSGEIVDYLRGRTVVVGEVEGEKEGSGGDVVR
jgi:hypothetical protein